MRRHTPSQPALPFASKPSWGGARAGAGRKKTSTKLPHLVRVRLKGYEPQHVTLKLEADVADVRRWRFFGTLVSALAAAQRESFRVVAWTIQRGHLHLVTEATDWKELSDGVRGLEIRVARAINRVLGRKGRVIADRYHARGLSSPTEVRNALVYVLQNARKHLSQQGITPRRGWLDQFSSAALFDGWAPGQGVSLASLREELGRRTRLFFESTAPPTTWLLREGWRRRGLIAAREVPRGSI